MNIINKIINKKKNPMGERQITIAFLGDSVTQGCFELYPVNDHLATIFDEQTAYPILLKKMFGVVYPSVPFSFINAGISGDTIEGGLLRLDRDVLSYSPDLVVVCFGLNHFMDDENGLLSFENTLKSIIERTIKTGAEIIIMTPNMIADHASRTITDSTISAVAHKVCTIDNQKNVSRHVDAMRAIASEYQVPLCDCYSVWAKLSESGANITDLLSNKINHPVREMHFVFAYELFKTILGE